jgi:bifunctional UDP-N-acetylglucosamine pyrophosphorylase / glucosamine-1-phosphate N-acetyltransferase
LAKSIKKVDDLLKHQDITIGEEVVRNRLSDGATIHPGCKLFGSQTLICQGAELGFEAPVTLKDCFVGPGVKLKGGFFENAVFLEGAEAGSGAHVRSGTILEEQASIAHTVGLKQTILFPFVTLGSLINFCDCFMAGGTSRKNHSEVGSSYIHFNFTPNQDKATASLIGDVPQGVMLNQKPIFLGGQGGLVGPCRIEYGTVIAAGSIYRKDQLKPDRLVFEGGGRGGSVH